MAPTSPLCMTTDNVESMEYDQREDIDIPTVGGNDNLSQTNPTIEDAWNVTEYTDNNNNNDIDCGVVKPMSRTA